MSDSIKWITGENWVIGTSGVGVVPDCEQVETGELMHFAAASMISQGNAEADARLIDAAPDLLDALEKLLAWCVSEERSPEEWDIAYRRAWIALKRAKGE